MDIATMRETLGAAIPCMPEPDPATVMREKPA
jgi:hypothetical protein